MGKAIHYTVSLPSRSLVDEFKRECKRRGHSQAFVIEGAMRYFISHPYAHGWGNGDEKQKKKTEQG